MGQVFSFVVAMTNIRRQLTVIKSNAHTHTQRKELGVTAGATPTRPATLLPPPSGAYAAQIFLQQFRFVCWVNLLSVMRPFSTRNFLILFHFV